MAEVINLRQARKMRQRGEREKLAAANRAKFGESSAERTAREQEQDRQVRLLDGHERDRD